MADKLCPLLLGPLLPQLAEPPTQATERHRGRLRSAARCLRGDCALWATTHTTEGIMVGTCGLVQPQYVRDV